MTVTENSHHHSVTEPGPAFSQGGLRLAAATLLRLARLALLLLTQRLPRPVTARVLAILVAGEPASEGSSFPSQVSAVAAAGHNAAAKADVEKTATLLKTEHDRANAAMWVAIATATRAQADLTTTVAVLKSQFEEQRQTYAGDITNVRLSVREIQDRLAGKRN